VASDVSFLLSAGKKFLPFSWRQFSRGNDDFFGLWIHFPGFPVPVRARQADDFETFSSTLCGMYVFL
jgi:hypothetical protein